MKHKSGTVLMVLGCLLLFASLSLFFYNQRQAETAQQASAQALDVLLPVIENRAAQNLPSDVVVDPAVDGSTAISHGVEDTAISSDPMVLSEVEVEGNSYIGVLYIPDLGLELPVLSELNDANLEIAPCYDSGSMITENLVIGAHNYMSHFARIWRLKAGAEVAFTNMNGVTLIYEVSLVETLSPTDGTYLRSGEYPLTLFTCTYAGNDRTAVRCVLQS